MDWQITGDRPVYLQLIEQLELAIAAGEYPPGARLPGVRELAAQAAVNPNTMQRALQELESRGLLASQRTAGRCVTGSGEAIAALRGRLAAAQAALFLERMGQLGYSRAESLAFLQPAGSAKAGDAPQPAEGAAGADERTPAARTQAPHAPKEE